MRAICWGLEKEIEPLLTFETGETYNAEKVNNISQAIVDKFSTLGYAFCTATPNPVANAEKDTVEIVYTIDPGAPCLRAPRQHHRQHPHA